MGEIKSDRLGSSSFPVSEGELSTLGQSKLLQTVRVIASVRGPAIEILFIDAGDREVRVRLGDTDWNQLQNAFRSASSDVAAERLWRKDNPAKS